jgi:hypothetical protein
VPDDHRLDDVPPAVEGGVGDSSLSRRYPAFA